MRTYIEFTFNVPNHRHTEIKNYSRYVCDTYMFLSMQINVTFCTECHPNGMAYKRRKYMCNHVHGNNCVGHSSFLKFKFNWGEKCRNSLFYQLYRHRLVISYPKSSISFILNWIRICEKLPVMENKSIKSHLFLLSM